MKLGVKSVLVQYSCALVLHLRMWSTTGEVTLVTRTSMAGGEPPLQLG